MHSGIAKTLYRYAWAYDEDDLDEMLECFVENARVHGGAIAPIDGRPAIRAFFEARRAERRASGEQTRHAITNIAILEETASETTVLCYLTLSVTGPDGNARTTSGWYRDRMIDESGTWRFKERYIHLDGTP